MEKVTRAEYEKIRMCVDFGYSQPLNWWRKVLRFLRIRHYSDGHIIAFKELPDETYEVIRSEQFYLAPKDK